MHICKIKGVGKCRVLPNSLSLLPSIWNTGTWKNLHRYRKYQKQWMYIQNNKSQASPAEKITKPSPGEEPGREVVLALASIS